MMDNPTTKTVLCPHCQAPNPPGAQFCESCGMAMPSMVRTSPRVIESAEFATTGVGVQLQSDALRKESGAAAKALLWVAIIQTVIGAIIVGLIYANFGRATPVVIQNAVTFGAIAALFWGLFFWARVQPLPAAIVGLVLYVTLVTINVFVAVSQISKSNGPQNGFSGIGISWWNIVIIVILCRAISSGLKYRKLMSGGATGAEVIASAGQ